MAVGTIGINRFAGVKLGGDKELKLKDRGSFHIAVSTDSIVTTKWFDNKSVLIASNIVAERKLDICKRWDKASKNYKDVSRPECIKLYKLVNIGVCSKRIGKSVLLTENYQAFEDDCPHHQEY